MQINRLFEIVHLLLNQKKTTTKQLADHFEVSKRTILRDIDTLSQAGIPIYTTPGKGGGVSILENYTLNKMAISDEEQNQILFALQSIKSAEHLEMENILSKLQHLFNKTEAKWIDVDFSRWGSITPDKEKFETLKNAIINNLTIQFDYVNSSGSCSNRTVYPLRLIYKSKSWYIYAYCLLKKDYRTFKVTRIISLATLPSSFDYTLFSVIPLEETKVSEELVHVCLGFSSSALYRLCDEFDVQDISTNDDDTVSVEINVPDSDWLYNFLLSFGTYIKKIEPPIVKEKFLAKVEEIRARKF